MSSEGKRRRWTLRYTSDGPNLFASWKVDGPITSGVEVAPASEVELWQQRFQGISDEGDREFERESRRAEAEAARLREVLREAGQLIASNEDRLSPTREGERLVGIDPERTELRIRAALALGGEGGRLEAEVKRLRTALATLVTFAEDREQRLRELQDVVADVSPEIVQAKQLLAALADQRKVE